MTVPMCDGPGQCLCSITHHCLAVPRAMEHVVGCGACLRVLDGAWGTNSSARAATTAPVCGSDQRAARRQCCTGQARSPCSRCELQDAKQGCGHSVSSSVLPRFILSAMCCCLRQMCASDLCSRSGRRLEKLVLLPVLTRYETLPWKIF